MRWLWRHPAAAALEGIGPFLKWLAYPVNIGSRAYMHWQQGSTTQEYRGAPIRAEGVNLVSKPCIMEIKLQQ
jgi:hypothetical protein